MGILAVPMDYRGTRFRSTLEADWAATFDDFRWAWNYEPLAVRVGGHSYLPDFYLPTMDVWCEVKGPHNARMAKVVALAKDLENDPDEVRQPMVVLLRPCAPGEAAVWEAVKPGSDLVIAHCPSCEHHTFLDTEGPWICRRCWHGQGINEDSKWWRNEYYRSGELAFQRAPRHTNS